ncbi:hypothetical protein DFR50_12684 [Roseiarcus fermentans]|uniref:Flagellar protein FlbD n=1 Tax=Roseiarcus fermentans TaxID=1473586 RepID=A0A366F3B5_9HYPH|nr:hypothetical protein [Roseiarcus fermentans]RBP08239.1 hypothetical protein DFR50_12684 [Roseiarcus fermentans]
MIPFLVVKTRTGPSYIRADRVIAIHSSEPNECVVLLTDGVTIPALEPAEDIVARLEAEAREQDDAQLIKENSNHGHAPR